MTPWAVAHQAPLSTEFPRQDYWNGLPFPSPQDLPDPGIEPESPALSGGFFTLSHQGRRTKSRTFWIAQLLLLDTKYPCDLVPTGSIASSPDKN